MVHITTHGCSAQLHPQLLDVRQIGASQVLLPRKCINTHAGNMCSHAGMHTHAGACAHMRQLQTHRAGKKAHVHYFICIHCTRAQSTDDNHGHLRVINDILIASLPGSSPTGRPHAGRDALRHPEMLAMGSKPRNSLPDIQNLAKELIAAKYASAMQSGPAAQWSTTLLRFQTDNDRRCAWPLLH